MKIHDKILLSKKTIRDEKIDTEEDIFLSSTNCSKELIKYENITNYNNSNDIEMLDNKYNNIFCPYSIYRYIYKSRIHIDLNEVSLIKTKIKIPQPSTPSKKDEQLKDNIENNLNNNTNCNKLKFIDSYAYIQRFPKNTEYLIYIKTKFYIIYNIETGEKIKTQRTNDAYGYQGIIPITKDKIFAVGADFLKVFNYNLNRKQLINIEPNNSYPSYENILYVKKIIYIYIVICKKTVCYLYNLLKYTSDKIIYLKSIIKYERRLFFKL